MNIWLDGQLLLYTSKFACRLGDRDNTGLLTGHMGKYFHELLQILVNWDENLRINTDKDLLFLLRRLLVRGSFSRKGDIFGWKKIFSDFKLLTLELFKLYHQSLKLKFLKYAAQVTTDFQPILAQSLCPNINVTFVMVVQKYLTNRYFFSKYKNPIHFFLSQQLIHKADLSHQFFEQE